MYYNQFLFLIRKITGSATTYISTPYKAAGSAMTGSVLTPMMIGAKVIAVVLFWILVSIEMVLVSNQLSFRTLEIRMLIANKIAMIKISSKPL